MPALQPSTFLFPGEDGERMAGRPRLIGKYLPNFPRLENMKFFNLSFRVILSFARSLDLRRGGS